MSDDFTCALCEGTFAKGLTDEEALAQFAREFPDEEHPPADETELICEDCFRCTLPADSALVAWRAALGAAVGQPVLVKFSAPPYLRRGTLVGVSSAGMLVAPADAPTPGQGWVSRPELVWPTQEGLQ